MNSYLKNVKLIKNYIKKKYKKIPLSPIDVKLAGMVFCSESLAEGGNGTRLGNTCKKKDVNNLFF